MFVQLELQGSQWQSVYSRSVLQRVLRGGSQPYHRLQPARGITLLPRLQGREQNEAGSLGSGLAQRPPLNGELIDPMQHGAPLLWHPPRVAAQAGNDRQLTTDLPLDAMDKMRCAASTTLCTVHQQARQP